MVHVIEASGVGWRGFCVSDGEEAAPDHSSRPRSRVKTKPESSDVHSLCGDDTCVHKCAWLCVPFMSLQCPDVSNNHSPPVVLLSFWFMQWHYDGITLLVFIWKATGLMLLLISSNWPAFLSYTTPAALWLWLPSSTCSSEVLKSLNHS